MKITVKKEVEEEIEVKTGFFKDYSVCYKIDERGMLVVSNDVISFSESNSNYYSRIAIEAIKYNEISEDEFTAKLLKTLETIKSMAGISSLENVMP